MSSTCGRTSFENSVSITIISLLSSASSSLMRLLASTTSVGSTNTVLPVDDSSCTIPLMRRFIAGAIGTTNLPSRRVGVTSFSTRPSLCAARSILYNVRETLPSALRSCERISASRGEAVSLIFPYLSRIWSIRLIRSGKVSTFSVRACRVG